MANGNQVTPRLPLPFKIYFEDQHLLVLSKPAGLLSQGESTGDENLVDVLRGYFGRNYVGHIHRLDRNTSGLMVVAKRSKSAERLTTQLQNGQLIRKYRALLYGNLEGTPNQPQPWEHWLLKNEKTNEVRAVKASTPGSKHALLNVIPLKRFPHPKTSDLITLAEFTLETGRSHQIRVQSHAMKHPLIGDRKYHSDNSLTLFPRPALHSSFLSFTHPISGQSMTFQEGYSIDLFDYFSTELE